MRFDIVVYIYPICLIYCLSIALFSATLLCVALFSAILLYFVLFRQSLRTTEGSRRKTYKPLVICLCADFQQKQKNCYATKKKKMSKYMQVYTKYTRSMHNTRRRPGGGSGPGRAAAAQPPPGILYIYIYIYILYIFYIFVYI